SAAGGAGGIFSFFGKLLTLSGGGLIPSAAGGMAVNDGKGGTLAIVHPNEMVLPSHLSQGIQTAINSGTMASAGGAGRAVELHYAPTIHAPETPDLKQL